MYDNVNVCMLVVHVAMMARQWKRRALEENPPSPTDEEVYISTMTYRRGSPCIACRSFYVKDELWQNYPEKELRKL